MAKKKEVKKSYILVESDYSPLTTHVYVVDKKGKKTEIPNVTSAKWEAVAGKACTLEFKALAKVELKVDEANTKKEEVPVVIEDLGYINSHWSTQFGAVAIATIATEDKSADYEMDAAHVYRLSNGKYATVFESGCSCYDSSDAAIELHDTEDSAMKSFNDWKG